MRIKAHIASSAIFGIVLWYIFKSISMAVAIFLSGVLIDLDHVLECYLNFGKTFNIWKTVEVCERYYL